MVVQQREDMNETAVLQERHVVLYDGDCPMCVFQMRLLTWLDWFHVIELLPIAKARKDGLAPGIAREDLLEAIHCLTRDGRIYRGARCLRFVGLRMPLLAPLSLFLWLPGVIWVAEIVYGVISRNRHLLSRWFGCRGACTIMPERRPGRKPGE